MSIRIEKGVYGGDGLARESSGRTVLLPYTLPGELVEEVAVDGSAFVQVLEASADRTEPRCIHFGVCGGCQYQMAQYSAQLKLKRDILTETLERAEVPSFPEAMLWPSPETWGYRNRIRLRVRTEHGAVRFGYNVRGSDQFLPIQMCPIAAPLLWKAASALLDATYDLQVAAWLQRAQEMVLSCDGRETRLQVQLLCPKGSRSQGKLDRVADVLKRSGLPVVSIVVSEFQAASGRLGAELARWGSGGFQYEVAQDKFWLEPGTFFQVNRFLLPAMVELVCGKRSGLLAWDLYAGVGLFSRRLARQFQSVIAVEANDLAIPVLQHGLSRKTDHAVHATTLTFLQQALVQRERPHLVVLDPPRAGAGEEICACLLQLRPETLIYVSCDPSTLARDLRWLLASTYRIAEVHMLDMFPQTYHLETVMVLERVDVPS